MNWKYIYIFLITRALNQKFYSFSLGGLADVAEIKVHEWSHLNKQVPSVMNMNSIHIWV
jgi:hypothetical protein